MSEDFEEMFDDEEKDIEDSSSSNDNFIDDMEASSNEDAYQHSNNSLRNKPINNYNQSDNQKIQRAFNHKNFFKRPIANNEVDDSDNSEEDIENQDENQEEKSTLKSKIQEKLKGGKKDKSKDKNDVSEDGKKAVKALLKPLKIKIILTLSTIAVGLLLVVFILYLILSPLMDAWESIDRGARTLADSVEKFTNFYKGFGFQDSKEAFFEEIDILDEFYDEELDMALLLSTIFYPETMGYDTRYQDHLAAIENDPVNSLLSGGVDGFISYMKIWIKDILNEAGNTYDDETGLTYNAAKIYRLRRLAAAMCDRSGTEETKTLSEFMNKFSYLFSTTISNVLWGLVGAGLETIKNGFKFIFQILTLQWDDAIDTLEDEEEVIGNLINSLKSFFDVITFGFFTINDVYRENGEYYVKYIPYKVNYDKYEEYLKSYYFEDIPEFRRLLPTNSTLREVKKDQIMNEINQNTKLFKEIFLKYDDGDSEDYEDQCMGAINNDLVGELALPVSTMSGSNISFSSEDSYGVSDGIMHKGVTLTKSNSGINVGDNVVSVAIGKVVGIGRSDGTAYGNTTGIWGSFRTYDIPEDELIGIARLCNAEQGSVEGAKAEASLIANKYEIERSNESLYDYVKDNPWWALRSRNAMPDSSYDNGDILEGVRDVLINGNRTLDPYVDEHDCMNCGDIKSIRNPNATYTDFDSINNRSNYIPNTTIITNFVPSDYTFYSFPTSNSDPFGYTSLAYTSVENNLENNSNWVKIEHTVVKNNTEYKFYTVYKYLDSIAPGINVGTIVGKEQTIGTVGTVHGYNEASLYFEFRNDEDDAIDPTNLFVTCSTNGTGELVGDTNEEQIWNYLASIGYSKIAAAGIMGNWQQESGFMPNNLENGANSKSGLSDEEFTSQVNSGAIDRSTFISSSRFSVYSGGRYGYGLAQWTDPGRKTNFYDFYKENSDDVSDLKMQLDFYAHEKEGYSTLDSSLDSQTTPEDAASTFCRIYEVGTANELRRSYARQIYERYKDYTTRSTSLNNN